MVGTPAYSRYRWVLLGLSWFFMVSLAWGIMLISPLAKPLMADLNIAHGALMALFGAPTIIRIFVGIPAGVLSDRFGFKRMIAVAGIIAGVFGMLRGVSSNYVQFFIFALTYGIGMALVMPNLPKLIREWFPPNQIGTASGLNATGFATGMAIALATTYPLFGFNWRAASYVNGATLLAISVAWLFLAKEKTVEKSKEKIGMQTTIQNLPKAFRHPDVWMVSLMAFFLIGGLWAFEGQLPVALEHGRAIEPTAAGLVSSMISIGLLVSNAFGPMLSDRIGRRKPFIILGPILGALAAYLAWVLPFGAATSVLSFIAGIGIGSAAPLSFAIITEDKGIPSAVLGTAVGVISMISAVGMFVIPLAAGYISDWFPGYNATFIFIAIMLLLTVVFSILVSETGPKAQTLAVARSTT